jgi:hypothetical protein
MRLLFSTATSVALFFGRFSASSSARRSFLSSAALLKATETCATFFAVAHLLFLGLVDDVVGQVLDRVDCCSVQLPLLSITPDDGLDLSLDVCCVGTQAHFTGFEA